jgi:beta-galactosidase
MRSLRILKLNGFNLVKLQEHWMVDEPLEGQYDFSRCEELIEAAAGLDLAVSLELACEQAPGWLYEKYPDGRMIVPAGGGPGPCLDHPGLLADQQRFITRLVETLGKYENLVVWNSAQEIGQEVCYCEHTLQAFRDWLDETYSGLDGLNRAWNTRHGDWRFVRPERGLHGQNGLPQEIDWRFFRDNVRAARLLRASAAAIRQADPLQRPIFAHKDGIALGHAQDWVYARAQDFLSVSCYPAYAPFHPWDDSAPRRGVRVERAPTLLNEMSAVALTFDALRSCSPPGAPVWAVDFQGGPIQALLHKGRVPNPADIRRWMLTAVGSGVTGISFGDTCAEALAQEVNGFSLLDSSGDSTPRLREAALVGAALNRHADLFAGPSWGGAEVGILVNEANAQCSAACPPAGEPGEHLAYSTRGWHRLLWELGVPLDFVNAAEVSEATLASYKLLILPFPLSLSEEIAQKLGEYVYAGGALVSEVTPGRLDEHGAARRGEISPIFANLFGVSQTGFSMVREPGLEDRWTPPEHGWGEFLEAGVLQGDGPLEGFSLPASLYVQTFECQGSQPVLKFNGRPAGAFRVGRQGWAWLIGTCVGHSALAYRRPETLAFVRTLLAQCNVRPLHKGKLLVRKRAIPGKRAWFFTNPNPEPLTESIWVGSVTVEDLFGLPLERNGEHISLTVDGLDVRVLVVTKV